MKKVILAVLVLLLLVGAGLYSHYTKQWSFFVYFVFFVVISLLLFPELTMVAIGVFVYGPVWGTVYAVISASASMTLAFLISRYFFREAAIRRLGDSETVKRINHFIVNKSMTCLAITRFIPAFPFGVQSYVYGLSDINFFVYWVLSTLFIIPGTVIYAISVAAVISGDFSVEYLVYLAVGVLILLIVFFAVRIHRRRQKAKREALLREAEEEREEEEEKHKKKHHWWTRKEEVEETSESEESKDGIEGEVVEEKKHRFSWFHHKKPAPQPEHEEISAEIIEDEKIKIDEEPSKHDKKKHHFNYKTNHASEIDKELGKKHK